MCIRDRIFVRGNTATKLWTGGGRGLLWTCWKEPISAQITYPFLAEYNMFLRSMGLYYNHYLRLINTFSRILSNFPFLTHGGAWKFLYTFNLQYIPISIKKKTSPIFHHQDNFHFINFPVCIAVARLPDMLWQLNLAGGFLDNLATIIYSLIFIAWT